MPADVYFEQQKRIASARMTLAEAMSQSDEREIAIWLAALVEMIKRVSDWNLEAERNAQE